MAISDKITQLTTDLGKIRNKLIALGLVTATAGYDACATAIDTMANKGTVDAEVKEGETYTIAAGYYMGGTVKGVAGGGSYNLQTKTGITPTKSAQTITPDSGYYGLASVQIAAIPDAYQDVSGVTATAADVLVGKTFVPAGGVLTAGTMVNNGKVTKILDVDTTSYTIPEGYHNGEGSVSIILEEKTVTPTTSVQVINPSTGSVLEKVTVNAIPSIYVDASHVDADASMVVAGKIVIGKDASGNAAEIVGTMVNHGAVSETLDGVSTTSYTGAAGYYSSVSVTFDESVIEAQLAALL